MSKQPIGGAIRWDAWFGHRGVAGIAVERSLAPKEWHSRLPFFARILGDNDVSINGASQQTVEREIQLAGNAGLDYWAFVSYAPDDPSSLALHFYLKSRFRRRLKFALILESSRWSKKGLNTQQIERDARLLSSVHYQTVLDGRPLLFLIVSSEMNSADSGNLKHLARSIQYLRRRCSALGGHDPYIVILQWDPEQLSVINSRLGTQAISVYSIKDDHAEGAPYDSLAKYAEQFWDRCRETHAEAVPIVMAGWDRRPRVQHPVPWEAWQSPNQGIQYFYRAHSPNELKRHLENAIRWVKRFQTADPANAVLIYAGNEIDEVGWLVPTLAEGTLRLDAIGELLEQSRRSGMAEGSIGKQ